MTKSNDTSDALRKAAAIIQKLERRIESDARARTEPIAIVGVGCRLPGGVADLESLWTLLSEGRDTVAPIPNERFDLAAFYNPDPANPGTSYVHHGAFLAGFDRFDAEFFGISPREAAWIDPQHRLILECVYEALENAGIPVRELRGTNTGVFVGIGASDYSFRIGNDDKRGLEGYRATGTGASFAAGRLSYLLGLHGPSLSVDTACSSSLTAIHLACLALRAGESRLALAVGVQLMLAAGPFVLLSRLRALSPDGRCKTFSNRADGYGRGEGCGVVALKLLSEARRDGDHVLGVIRGSAINQDGASSGLTTPNGGAQRSVLRRALREAHLVASDIDYVEAHGTGTALGDPIEVEAIADVYGRDRSMPLQIGAIKTNIGHLEAAAGLAGVLKVLCCLEHRMMVPSLHSEELSQHIDWESIQVRVVHRLQEWLSEHPRPRRAGVSSFGMSGTNAHVVLEEAPAVEQGASAPVRTAELVVLSAKTPEALSAAAGRLREHLASHPELSLGDTAYSLVTTRSLLEQRLTLSVRTRETLLEGLQAAAQGQTPIGARRGAVGTSPGKLAWLFTGQGAQRLGMGRELYGEWPVFREAFAGVCALFEPLLEVPLREVMWAEEGSSRAALLDQTGYTQPALFALEWALASLWRSWGVEPELLLGHSIGEVAAATVAGIFSLEDAVKLVGARARLMQALPRGGAMVSIAASEEQVRPALRATTRVSLAAVNGPSSVVIAGSEREVSALAESFRSRGVQTKRLTVSHAFHSPLMEPMLEAFREVAESLSYHSARIPLVADTTGALGGSGMASAEYWVRHVRETVRFGPGVQALAQAGADTYLELGPKPTLLGLVPACLPEQEPVLLAALRPTRSEPEAVLEALGGWVVRGGSAEWRGVFPSGGRRVPLPTYPWQRKRFWVEATATAPRRAGIDTGHPLLGARISAAGADAVYESVLSAAEPSWLTDHRVAGQVVVPGAAVAELVRAAAEDHARGETRELRHLVLQLPLIVPLVGGRRIQVLVTEQGTRASVYSQPAEASADAEWTLHATAEVGPARSAVLAPLDVPAIRSRCSEPLSVSSVYASFRALGLEYGAAFQGLRKLWKGSGEALAEVALPGVVDGSYGIHPALLDAALQAVGALVESSPETPLLPFEIDRFTIHQLGRTAALVHVRLLETPTPDEVVARVTLMSASGDIILEIGALTLRRAELAAFSNADVRNATDCVYRIEWESIGNAAASTEPLSGRCVVVSMSDTLELAESIADSLRRAGASSEVATVARLSTLLPADRVVCVFDAAGGPDAASRMASDGLMVAQVLGREIRPSRLWWLTHQAVAVTIGEDVDPASAAVWGLGRTLMQEHPALGCVLVDLERGAPFSDVVRSELSAGGDENQVAWRRGQRHAARLVRASPRSAMPAGDNYQLEVRRRGTLDSLTLTSVERRAPAPGHVEIEVVASGLNFRDVLNALGMYPGEAGLLGGECSGRVTAIGAGVVNVAVGDEVMALAAGAFRRFVTVDSRLTAPVPLGVSLESAATLPIAFLTAWYALHDLAALRPGERLLVHAAAGGVGMAAVQLAHWMGAQVLGTASPAKWDAVRALGVRYIASSRDLGFAQAFRAAPGGVDVVLNALAGDFVDASLSLLSPGGRFVEMGKTDVRDAAQVAALYPYVSYRAFDLLEAGPDRIAEMFASIREGFASGHLKLLPVRAFPISQAESAFRFMAQARHVGKIALISEPDVPRKAGTVLITGGLGALGIEVAKHFAQLGVEHLLLTGRRGLETPGAERTVAELRALGPQVTVAAVDVADKSALAQVLAAVPGHFPLRGIVHAAGILDDGVLSEQTAERFSRVMAPKVLGAWNLHELTKQADLDLFVLFSSTAGTLGSAGQSSYAAANAFLDGLATHRRAEGLCAMSVAWGPWSGGGLAARLDPHLQARFARQGVEMISPDEGRMLFGRALSYIESQLLVARLDLRKMAKAFAPAIPPLWRSLLRSSTSPSLAVGTNWRGELHALAPAARLETVKGVVQAEVARVLSLDAPAAVPLDRPLKDLGLDSLMAVELRNALGRRTGIHLPASLAFDHSVSDLSTNLLSLALQSQDSVLDGEGEARSSTVSSVTIEAPSSAVCEQLHQVEGARALLFCFHDAGGSAAMFQPFTKLEAAGIEVHAISCARHLGAVEDHEAASYLGSVVAYVQRLARRPYALFGHSLGSLFAWRVAGELARAGGRQPVLLAPSAFPPTRPGLVEGVLGGQSGLSRAIGSRAGNLENLTSFKAAFAADIALWNSMPEAAASKLDVPIAAFLARDDVLVSEAAMRDWEHFSARDVSLTILPGDHLYPYASDSRELLLEELSHSILRELFKPATHAPRPQPRRSTTSIW